MNPVDVVISRSFARNLKSEKNKALVEILSKGKEKKSEKQEVCTPAPRKEVAYFSTLRKKSRSRF